MNQSFLTNPVNILRSEVLDTVGITGLFTMRTGGVSSAPFDTLNLGDDLGDDPNDVAENHVRLMDAAGLKMPPHQAKQVHGMAVCMCSGAGYMHTEADILISTEAGCPVAVRTADCLPVLLADADAGVVAAVHAGWRGTVKNIASVAIHAMCQYGAHPSQILAYLGPCIGRCCFSVGEDVAALLREYDRNAVDDGYADLAAINIHQLTQNGIHHTHIEHIQRCTCCQPDAFFSFRRDGTKSGRHLACICMAKERVAKG